MQSKNALRIQSSKILFQYVEYLRNHQCVSEATVVIRRNFVAPFIVFLGNTAAPSRIHLLSPKVIHDYVMRKLPDLRRASKKHLVSSLRSFLRFAHVHGYLKRSLLEAVPVIACRKLENVPRAMRWEDVQKLLRAPDRRTPIGRRDYAVILLLATYGLRIGQVTTLRLSDIRWREGIINFSPSKNGKPLQFPLQRNVAEALLAYIRRDRGQVPFQQVFLSARFEKKPLSDNNHFGTTLARYCRLAKIKSPTFGSHAIRHAFATRLVEKGTSIKTIADLLGHKWIDTTFIYTKVDLSSLRKLARSWPEVGQ